MLNKGRRREIERLVVAPVGSPQGSRKKEFDVPARAGMRKGAVEPPFHPLEVWMHGVRAGCGSGSLRTERRARLSDPRWWAAERKPQQTTVRTKPIAIDPTAPKSQINRP